MSRILSSCHPRLDRCRPTVKLPTLAILAAFLAIPSSSPAQRSALYRNNAAITQSYLDAAAFQTLTSLELARHNLATNNGWLMLPPDPFALEVSRAGATEALCDLTFTDPSSGLSLHDRFILITNIPGATTLISGTKLAHVRARRIGRCDTFGQTVAVYDCAPPAPKVPDPVDIMAAEIRAEQLREESAKRKSASDLATFNFHKSQAEAGNTNSMRRLSELYQQGRGCPQDTNAAARWLKASSPH